MDRPDEHLGQAGDVAMGLANPIDDALLELGRRFVREREGDDVGRCKAWRRRRIEQVGHATRDDLGLAGPCARDEL